MSTTPLSENRRHGPAIPRWMLPSVRVRRRGDVITVEQRVPARVESIHTSRRDDSGSLHDEYHTPIYEAGLGSPTSVPLVKERLTVPASEVSEQQVRQAVDHAIAAYDPGTAALSVQFSGDALLRLLQTVFLLGMTGFGLHFIVIPFYQSASSAPPGDPFASFQKLLTVFPGIFILVAITLAVVCARAAWACAPEIRGRGAVGAVASDPDPAGRAGARLVAPPGH